MAMRDVMDSPLGATIRKQIEDGREAKAFIGSSVLKRVVDALAEEFYVEFRNAGNPNEIVHAKIKADILDAIYGRIVDMAMASDTAQRYAAEAERKE